MRLLPSLLWAVLALLVAIAAVKLRARLRERMRRPLLLDDDAVRRIEEEGRFVSDQDEPLDWEDIEEEERRFWASEEWDPADEGW